MNDHMFLILSGNAELSTKVDQGDQPRVLRINRGCGDTLGIMAFIDGRKHIASAKTYGDMRTAIMKRSDYARFKIEHPAIATKVIEYLVLEVNSIANHMMDQLISMVADSEPVSTSG